MSDLDQLEVVHFQPGDHLFLEGEQSYHFYIIQDGKVEIVKAADGGRSLTLAIVEEGASLGEFAMIDRQPRSATARAVTAVRAVKVSELAYEKLLADLPDWALAVMRGLVERLRQANEVIRKSREQINPSLLQTVDSSEYDPEISQVFVLGSDFDTPESKS